MSLYKSVVRPLLFCLPAEAAHRQTVAACAIAGRIPGVGHLTRALWESSPPQLAVEVAGLRLANPIGLAAGWDKSGNAVSLLGNLGFGFTEIGSVSAEPSDGNPRPRLFRVPQERAVVVNYGLPNDGAARVANRLRAHVPRVPLGVNLVTTNLGPAALPRSEEAILADFAISAGLVHRHASYLMLNLSCPNAEGGKDLFEQPGGIRRLLLRLQPLKLACPVFLKLPPSDSPADQDRWLTEVEPFDFVRGFSFNLPRGKPATLQWKNGPERWTRLPGAVSGRPVEALSNRCLAALYQRMDRSRYWLIGSGGVFTAEDAYQKIRLGASLVQIYTSLVYEGPSVVRTINKGLVELLRRDGFSTLQEAVGTAE